MFAYVIRRLILIIPTLFGIMVVNFLIVQSAPGGPVEQMIARIKGNEICAYVTGVFLYVSISSCGGATNAFLSLQLSVLKIMGQIS